MNIYSFTLSINTSTSKNMCYHHSDWVNTNIITSNLEKGLKYLKLTLTKTTHIAEWWLATFLWRRQANEYNAFLRFRISLHKLEHISGYCWQLLQSNIEHIHYCSNESLSKSITSIINKLCPSYVNSVRPMTNRSNPVEHIMILVIKDTVVRMKECW